MKYWLPLVLLLFLVPALLFSQTAGSTTGTSSTSKGAADTAGTATSSTDTTGTTTSANPASPGGSTAPSSTTSGAAANGGQAAKNEPVPYSPSEFPGWVNDLRRAEIITIGAFPISLLVTSLSYQLYRYVQNGFQQAYAPALLGSGSNPLSNQERIGVIISGIGVSLVIALIDYGLGKATK